MIRFLKKELQEVPINNQNQKTVNDKKPNQGSCSCCVIF
jgi:hypothetical protein